MSTPQRIETPGTSQENAKQNDTYLIRTMKREEVAMAVDWAAQEGWNPGLHDAACYISTDPNGFFIGLLDDVPVATISAIRYGASFGFLGLYIVKPEYRGKGYGLRLWEAGLKYLEGRNIGLDGVVAQQDNYQKSGFKPAYRNVRYEGIGGGTPPADPGIKALSSLPFEAVESFSRAFFPEDRSVFYQSWITQPGCTALGIIQGEKLCGYGVIRPCRSGSKIGPLYAESPELAESLFLALKSTVTSEEPVYLDVPEPNGAAISMARRHEMRIVFETARMYSVDMPETPLDCIFGVTSFEIG